MKYLDEGVEVIILKEDTQYGVATFRVYADNQLIFVGKTYVLNDNSGYVAIDITDICASYRWDNWLAKAAPGIVGGVFVSGVVDNWVAQFTVELSFDNIAAFYTESEWVSLFYRNPETLSTPSESGWLLQPGLEPHAPLLRTMNNLFVNFRTQDGGGCLYTIYNGLSIPSWATDGSHYLGYVLDGCPARYYLRWSDRWGGVQSQPMTGKRIYSEDITTQEIQNAQGHRRGVQWQVQPKWQLNTGFLTDKVMPNYESIFVSPYVVLYDTELDLLFDVIVTDKSYTHKTYKNDRMFNLTLNVELDKRQNILN